MTAWWIRGFSLSICFWLVLRPWVVACRDTRLSNSLLTQIWHAVTPFGDSLQRLLEQRNKKLIIGCTKPLRIWLLVSWLQMMLSAMLLEGGNTLLTGIVEDPRDLLELEVGLKSLMEEVAAPCSGIRLEFQVIKEPVTASLFTSERFDVREGEALTVNSIKQLHKYAKESRGSLNTILQAIKKIRPCSAFCGGTGCRPQWPFLSEKILRRFGTLWSKKDRIESRGMKGQTNGAATWTYQFSGSRTEVYEPVSDDAFNLLFQWLYSSQ
ncbi:hypothetical protein HAX54_001367 [Datura stramonium]|uniref:Uncharacterized protein n=1 Tax=Datura stramonium TaxID=4076 RepID=A0ABS8T2Y4_DATST|nr:hypothetical protein [Datura stramonium]